MHPVIIGLLSYITTLMLRWHTAKMLSRSVFDALLIGRWWSRGGGLALHKTERPPDYLLVAEYISMCGGKWWHLLCLLAVQQNMS